jgi:tellurite methyltransferase
MSKPFWETTYADLDASTFGGASQEVRDIISRLHAGARVLDLGCGEGRNALFLSESGFDVTAVDISETGILKLRFLAEQKNLNIRSVVCDIRSYFFTDTFDLIMCHGCLHLVERESWQELIRKFKINTNDGGYNIIVVFTDEIPPPVRDLKRSDPR